MPDLNNTVKSSFSWAFLETGSPSVFGIGQELANHLAGGSPPTSASPMLGLFACSGMASSWIFFIFPFLWQGLVMYTRLLLLLFILKSVIIVFSGWGIIYLNKGNLWWFWICCVAQISFKLSCHIQFGLKKRFICKYVFVCRYVHLSAGTLCGQEMVLDPVELELEAFVRLLMLALEIQLRSFERAATSLPTSSLYFLKTPLTWIF